MTATIHHLPVKTTDRPLPPAIADLALRRRIALVREVYAQVCARRGWSPDPWSL